MEKQKNIYTWKEIQKKFPNMWVAISNFSDDPENRIKTQGEVYASSPDRSELNKLIEKKGDNLPLAIDYTGDRGLEDFHGGIWPDVTL